MQKGLDIKGFQSDTVLVSKGRVTLAKQRKKGLKKMNTVKTYLVRKPSDLDEVISTTKSHLNDMEEVVITETVELDPQAYQELTDHPLRDHEFLKGKGGYNDDGQRTAVAITCKGKQTLIAEPSGSAYCRYLGIME